MTIEEKIRSAHSILREAVDATGPIAIFGMFSGGHDSLTATALASTFPGFTGAAHMNTGIGIEETREFVRKVSADRGWKLREYKALDCGQDYAALASEFGFPGPGQHRTMYIRLKERPLRRLIADAKAGHPRRARVALVTGIRAQESSIRMGRKEWWRRDGAYVWINPIYDWSKSDCHEYMEREGLPRNPVVDLLHMSGECLCGAFAHEGERKEIRTWFPSVDKKLSELESIVGGHVKPLRRQWGWCALVGKGSKPPKRETGPMCHGCDGRMAKGSDVQSAADKAAEQAEKDWRAQQGGKLFADS